jgi:hypothetical protein
LFLTSHSARVMVINEHQKNNDTQTISPLANDPTYGERVFQRIYGPGLNFGLNLIVSAAFTYWVNHSHTPIKLAAELKNILPKDIFGKSPARPAEFQSAIAQWIAKKPIMNFFKTEEIRNKAAGSMASVLTLTAAGHAVMIPSVWLGAKVKSPFIEWLDRKHYGEAGLDDPSLKARHEAIRHEERPNLFGAVIGRLGTVVATQTAAYTIGHDMNILRSLSKSLKIKPLQEFKGIDHITEFSGDRIGGMISEAMPTQVAKLNAALVKRNYGWSLNQAEKFPKIGLFTTMPYGTRRIGNDGVIHGGGFAEHYGRYVVSDIMYTLVTSLTIAPAITLCKKFIPFMTYHPKRESDAQSQANPAEARIHTKPVRIMDVAAPDTRVSNVALDAPLASRETTQNR